MKTEDASYAERLDSLETVWWKRVLDVQRPYRWHLRRLRLGFVLDIGCGVGRNLVNLGGRSAGVGVDHNARSIAIARARGLDAYTVAEFLTSPRAIRASFDTLLLSHVAEHMRAPDVVRLLEENLRWVRPNGRVVVVTPQEAGFASDPTHLEFMDWDRIERIVREVGCVPTARYSFPFPRAIGRWFKYNEFVVLARKGQSTRGA